MYVIFVDLVLDFFSATDTTFPVIGSTHINTTPWYLPLPKLPYFERDEDFFVPGMMRCVKISLPAQPRPSVVKRFQWIVFCAVTSAETGLMNPDMTKLWECFKRNKINIRSPSVRVILSLEPDCGFMTGNDTFTVKNITDYCGMQSVDALDAFWR